MKLFIFIIKSALEDFRRNKLRTSLTSLGILIGVASVVLLSALGVGLKAYIQGQFESLARISLLYFQARFLVTMEVSEEAKQQEWVNILTKKMLNHCVA